MDFVRGLASGLIPRPPMAETMPFELLSPEHPGTVELLSSPEPHFANLVGTAHGGWIMTMLDTAMALAAQTMLGPGESCPSHETTAKFLLPIALDGSTVRVIGRALRRGRSFIALDGEVRDAGGELAAHGTSTCLIINMQPAR